MIIFDNVVFSYSNSKKVINNISFKINKGEYVSIVGANGSGKSTISKLINGLLIPSSGEVLISGMNTCSTKNIINIRKKVGLIFQNPEDQIVTTMVSDEVAFGLENISLPSKKMKNIIKISLEKVGMSPYYDKETYSLSGGQKQRVAIASIIAMQPQIVVFDESTAMLDPNGRKQILEIMKELHNEGFTIINITHNMDEVFDSSRVIVIGCGEIVKDGTPIEVFNDLDVIRNNNLEIPFIIRLYKELLNNGINIPKHILDIEGVADYLWKYS